MTTPKQIEANRANSRKSTGPVSIDGKRRSSQNAVRHGLTASRRAVLANESPQGLQTLIDELTAEYQPRTSTEQQLVWDIAYYRWRLSRTGLMEAALLDLRMDRQSAEVDALFRNADEAARTAYAWSAEADSSAGLSLLNRYETRLHRAWHRSVSALRAIQAGLPAACKRAA